MISVFYAERARGGVGLIVAGGAAVSHAAAAGMHGCCQDCAVGRLGNVSAGLDGLHR
jgi:2,4-dienoyl-CoA reductase-like NADH-dependent reductase (Old Yellow Enzyme family)